jgi:hypothetical protein
MRNLGLLLLFSLTAFSGPSTAAENPLSASVVPRIVAVKTVILPETLQAFIETTFPDYELPSERDYFFKARPDLKEYTADLEREIARLRSIFLENIDKPTLPYICWGDFNGDARRDVAMFLMRRRECADSTVSRAGNMLFIAFHRTPESYAPVVIQSFSDRALWNEYLQAIPPRKILTLKGQGMKNLDEDMPEFIEKPYDTIVFGFEGKAASLFYWEDKRYKSVLIAD